MLWARCPQRAPFTTASKLSATANANFSDLAGKLDSSASQIVTDSVHYQYSAKRNSPCVQLYWTPVSRV